MRVKMAYRITVRIKMGIMHGKYLVQHCTQWMLNKYLPFLTLPINILFDSHNNKSYCPFLETEDIEAQRLTQDPTVLE